MRPLFVLIALLTALFLSESLPAHHGRGDRYDMASPIKLEGSVKEVFWRNPHIAILVDVIGEDSEVVTWIIEHSNVHTLARMGYHRNTLRPGQKVTAVVNPSTSGNASGLCEKFILADDSEVFIRGATVD